MRWPERELLEDAAFLKGRELKLGTNPSAGELPDSLMNGLLYLPVGGVIDSGGETRREALELLAIIDAGL